MIRLWAGEAVLERTGNIWDWHSEGRWTVITTNIGWRKDGACPMGAGVAKKAAELYPELPEWYGNRCKRYGAQTAVAPYDPGHLILFPTKPLNEVQPWLSWQNDADLALIERSAKQLVALVTILEKLKKLFGLVGLPMVGCGNGNLKPRDVLWTIRPLLDDRFILLTPK